ncbi:hypothetical protein D0Z07_0149 [Hyphodiscus hymeniophilus]|uniref:SP-RING-type domain-containing protein n=1 Tax=Hyphodiscus hymeniophilus TaxID=353542 RepID=A0A9P6VR03_9HELO|nr:hypothetical protein D0Z07_0149 [Hyphodiscus hymeniophilus]
MSDRDVDSSNATLNTLFGGARQKSWMLGPRASVRPTPRPSISKASGQNAASVQKNSAAVLPSPASSDEPSPILLYNTVNNVVQIQNQRQVDSNDIQRPGSVAQRPVGLATQPSEAVTQPSITQAQPRISQSLSQGRASRPTSAHVNTVPPAPSSTLGALPSGSTARSLADGQATFRSAQDLRSPSLPIPNPNLVQAFVLSGQLGLENAAQPANETSQRPADTQQTAREQLLSPSPMPSSPPTMELEQPPLPASVLLPIQNQPNSFPSTTQSKPHKRQRIQVPAPSLKGRVALIDAHVESAGGPHSLNTDLERPRFQLLSEACNSEDTFYVALHQLFCIWDSPMRGLLSSIPEFPHANILQISFKVLSNLIRENKGLAPNHLKWFLDFPSPLADLMRTSEAYQKIVSNVGRYLERLASDWGPFSKVCATRGYPPLVDELIQRMGLTSPILQHIMFTATRRNLGVEDDMYGEQMEKIFAEDKQGHQELAARFYTGRPPTEGDIINRNQQLIDKYLTINNHRIRTRRISWSAIASGSPLVNSHTVPIPADIHRTVSNNSNDASMAPQPINVYSNANHTFPSPDAWHQTQHTQQQQQRTVSNPSPNPLVQAAAGRPLGGSGIRAYSKAPSPIMLQTLSMNSPIMHSPGLQQQSFQWATPVLRSNSFQVQQNPMAGQPTGVAPTTPLQHLSMQQQQHIAAQQQQQIAIQAQEWQQQGHPHMHQQFHPQMHQQVQPQMLQRGQLQMYQHAPQVQQAQQRQPNDNAQQAHLSTLQQIPQSQSIQRQQQQNVEHQRRQISTAAQQVLSMQRAARSRSSGDHVDMPQRVPLSNTSVSNIGRTPDDSNSPNLALPRPIPSFIPSPIAQKHVVDAYSNAQPLQRILVPPLGYQQSSQPYNPELTALHQAHIRSPRLVPQDVSAKALDDVPSRRFYQCVKTLAMAPVKIPISSSMSYLEFSITEESSALISRDKIIGTDRVPVREFKRGSLQYRLRCISSKRETTKCPIPEWIISDTVWPETVFVEINDHQLEVRRKNHHGKDLPIDITQYVFAKTSDRDLNHIKISIPRLRKAMREHSYFVAVEVVEVLQHPQIMEMCTLHQRIPASVTLDGIKKSLASSPTEDEDEDDFAMVVSDLSIDLADPWTACIFEIPVRGNTCLHRECFDLETFLVTRNSKSKRPNQPSMIDVWKCPLCGRDARPYSLRVDEFLAGVRTELAAQDRLDTKAILISADGSWRAKPEPRTMKRKATGDQDNDDPDSSDGEGTARRQQAVGRKNNPHLNGSSAPSKEVEVIELDDD